MKIIQLSHVEIQIARAAGKMRSAACAGYASTRTMTPENDFLGCCGEIAFANYMGIDWDWKNYPEGDNGIDFIVNEETVDVKASGGEVGSRRLMVVKGKVFADMYVLAVCSMIRPGEVTLAGWQTRKYIADLSPYKPGGFVFENHIVENGDLLPITGLMAQPKPKEAS